MAIGPTYCRRQASRLGSAGQAAAWPDRRNKAGRNVSCSTGGTPMKTTLRLAALAAGISVTALGTASPADTGGVLTKAVGGYTFEDAAKEAAATKDFNS